MNNLVSIIILNWNGLKFIDKCIKSVIDQSYKNIEIILVDNNSTDGSFEKVCSLFEIDNIVKNVENLGFAKGMNIGIEKATGDFIMTLNMDVFLMQNAIENAIETFRNHSNIGVIMGKELSWINDELINKETNSAGPGFLKLRGQGFSDKNKINIPTLSFGAMGSFPIFRKSVLEQLKDVTGYYFDPKFETGWEDKDIFFRCHHLGWKFYYNPKIIGYHAVSGSVNNKSKLIDKDIKYQKRIFRNRYYFIFKNYPLILLLLHSPFLMFTELMLYPYYLCKNPKSIIALLSAKKEFINNIKIIYNDRKRILKKSELGFKELISFFKIF